MHTQGRLNSGRTITYALGLVRDTWRGVPVVSHGGATAGYRAFLARYPDQRLDVAVVELTRGGGGLAIVVVVGLDRIQITDTAGTGEAEGENERGGEGRTSHLVASASGPKQVTCHWGSLRPASRFRGSRRIGNAEPQRAAAELETVTPG